MRVVALALVLAACILAGNGDAFTMKHRTLQAEARWVASHGGITGHGWGDATSHMRNLVRKLIVQRFRPAGWTATRRALCYAHRESGDNPGAISPSDDHGVAQIHRASYHPFDYYRLTHDPVYSVQVFWVVSSHGRDFGPVVWWHVPVLKTGVSYQDWLDAKRRSASDSGFSPDVISDLLYDFQRDTVEWAARKGRCALFADCGLGKTPMQLEWARLVCEHTNGSVLILAPLAVADQTVREGVKFGIEVTHARERSDLVPGISVTNYERVERFADLPWAGVVLDESSILKAFDGKTRAMLTEWAQAIPYRLCATATPSPNDHEELGGHSEFLGVLNRRQMLAEFFVNDGLSAAHWRLKGHAGNAYWRWIASWARAFRDPRDLGYDGGGFDLPRLEVHFRDVEGDHVTDDRLFAVPVSTLSERRQARRESLSQRVEAAIELVNSSTDAWVVWCDLNSESDALARAIPDAVEVRGSNTPDEKEERLFAFSTGQARVIVTKPRIGGWGLNWQHCANVCFVGLSDSYESYYQAIRRCWRYGQTRPVHVHIIASRLEQTVLANIRRKEKQAVEMFDQVIGAMRQAT